MSTWIVAIPITARAYVDVEADNKEDAIEKGLKMVELDHVVEWWPHYRIHAFNRSLVKDVYA